MGRHRSPGGVRAAAVALLAAGALGAGGPTRGPGRPFTFDVVVVGGTPAGIMASIAASRGGRTAVLLERTAHVGGLPANGLGATDIATRGATGGLFREFVDRIRAHYVRVHGADSPQVRASSDGYRFEPSVAERVFGAMLAEAAGVTVRRMRQFDAHPRNVRREGRRVAAIRVRERRTGAEEVYAGAVFVDATYEGDLAAAAGVPYRVGREGGDARGEPLAGIVYKRWGGPPGPHSTNLADNAVQAYNYRLCLTADPANRVPIPKPARYDREEYASLVADVLARRTTGEGVPGGIARLVNQVPIPNGKTDSNNQHLAFISTDLPEENWPWPTASWDWRDRFARRLRDYTLGLLWFAQHDPALPASFRQACLRWGLAGDEYADNGHFPRQVYVREGRRIVGAYDFTAYDALPVSPGARPPVHGTSITASHYAIDSHAVRKREPGRVHLDGFLSLRTGPYTVPYGVIVPRDVDGLLAPGPVSGTHLGFGTLRMEPCWMALGQAAGTAAALAIEAGVPVRDVDPWALGQRLLARGAVLIYYEDAASDHPAYAALQTFGLWGLVPGWKARLEAPVRAADAARWIAASGMRGRVDVEPGRTTRGDLLQALYARVRAEGPPAFRVGPDHVARGPYAAADGTRTFWITSPYQVGATSLRILRPEPSRGPARRILFVLPVEPDGEARYGDGLQVARRLDLANRYGMLVVAPGFARVPWYADHPTDRGIRQERFLVRVVVPLVDRLFPTHRPYRLLMGFSKSGWGAYSLILRHPDLFDGACAWDAPLMADRPTAWGMGEIFGTAEAFEAYRVGRLLRARAAAFRAPKRLALFGEVHFADHVRRAHALMEELGIPHDYAAGPRGPHRWDAAWVERAAAWLDAMTREPAPPAGR